MKNLLDLMKKENYNQGFLVVVFLVYLLSGTHLPLSIASLVDTFLGKIEKMSDDDIIRKFSDSIFFADEIHSGLTKSRYEPMYRLFHLIRRSKVFLASATPLCVALILSVYFV